MSAGSPQPEREPFDAIMALIIANHVCLNEKKKKSRVKRRRRVFHFHGLPERAVEEGREASCRPSLYLAVDFSAFGDFVTSRSSASSLSADLRSFLLSRSLKILLKDVRQARRSVSVVTFRRSLKWVFFLVILVEMCPGFSKSQLKIVGAPSLPSDASGPVFLLVAEP